MSDILRLTSENMQTYTIDIRPRRQATFPKALLKELDLDVGDKLEAKTDGKKIILKAKRQMALDALKEIQRIVKESGVPEKELQEAAINDRKKWAQKYAAKNLS